MKIMDRTKKIKLELKKDIDEIKYKDCFFTKLYNDGMYLGRILSYNKDKQLIKVYNLPNYMTLYIDANNMEVSKYVKDYETYYDLNISEHRHINRRA